MCTLQNIRRNLKKEKKKKIKIGKYSKIFINPNLKSLTNPFFNGKNENKLNLWIKFLIKNFFNFSIFNKKKYLDLGGRSELKKDYIKKNNIPIIETYPELIINIHYNKTHSNYFRKLLSPTFNFLIKDIKNTFNLSIDLSDLQNIWFDRYSIIYHSLNQMLKKKNNYSGILLNNIYKPSSRFMGLYFMMKNKKAISFDHGNHANGRKNHRSLSYQLLSYNTFVTISKNSRNSLLKTSNNSLMSKTLKNLKIKYIKNSYLRKIFETKSNYNNKAKIKNIMIMGWPMNSRKYFDEGPCSFFYNKMLFEIELIKFLKKNKFKVFYKAHPERPEGISSIYGKFVDKIFFEKIEDQKNFEDIDTLIFTNTCSSSFGYSLCTNKKIILYYNENYFDDHIKVLKKRVKLLPLKFNYKYHADFNKLLKELKKVNSANDFNYDYIKKYLI